MAFKYVDHNQLILLPTSFNELLPDKHLAKFVVNIVKKLDFYPIICSYSGQGKEAYPPFVLLSLLIYSYITGTFLSRAIERNTHESVPVVYICCGLHPDHSTIADFRNRFAPTEHSLFIQLLEIAKELGVLNLGTVYQDGTKIKANASKHHAYSYQRATEIKAQLEKEVEELMKMAAEADAADQELAKSIIIPDEIKIREGKIAGLEKAIDEITRRAAERYAVEKEAYEAKLKAREKVFEDTGKKARGSAPQPPVEGPKPKRSSQFD
jgi:transposase